jgi:gamma-glutamyltranspeptidase/glutathione hydrolase
MAPTRPELVGSFGMVASTHWLASATAMRMLELGGNAADAAVAAGFVLQVVEPHLSGPAGEVPIILWSQRDKKVSVISGQGVAPQAASLQRFADLGLDIMPGTGLLPAVVPGAFGAWMVLLEEHGTMSVREVLEPAIYYARSGHPFLANATAAVGAVARLFREDWPTSADIWLAGGAPPAPGSRFTNPALADTYSRVLEESEAAGGSRERQIHAARRSWYQGFVAEAIDAFCSSTEVVDSSGERHGGLLTGSDLAHWSPRVEEPEQMDYLGYTVFKTKAWGQGPLMLQQLAMLKGMSLDSIEVGSADWVHAIVETGKLAFADREAWYGDPRFTDVPVAALLSEEYNRTRRELIDERASLDLRPGDPAGRIARLPRYPQASGGAAAEGTGEPTVAGNGEVRGDTCHIDVVDANGMMISATPSGGWLQSSPAIPQLGFALSNRGQMFWLEPGLPNSLRPGARPRTTLSPSFAFRDGEPWLAFGSPGGDSQEQWQVQLFLSLVHSDLNLQQAIDSPAFHSDHAPSSFYPREAHPGQLVMEERFPVEVRSELELRGHRVLVGAPWSEGRLSAVARDSGWLKAAANPRGNQGYAVGR